MDQLPRSEYPRPQFRRDNWLCLNGAWEFSFAEPVFDRMITVPYACETVLSGIGETGFHPVVWYRRSLCIPEQMRGKTLLLHFGAVDYRCRLWVNDRFLAEHEGGQTGFCADITDVVGPEGETVIRLMVEDDPADLEIPRGKQYWEPEAQGIFYTRTTGIWQPVWLEAVDPLYLKDCRITPDYDNRSVHFTLTLSGAAEKIAYSVRYADLEVARGAAEAKQRISCFTVSLENVWQEEMAWTPERPSLFQVTLTLMDALGVTDRVETYFGIRKVSIENGVFLLNGRPYYQKLVLDQGYWEDSLLTAPTDEDFIRDISLTKAMGFNGVRKHQKVEDPRYLYHADRMGLLVWGEFGAAYRYSEEYAQRMYAQWPETVLRDYNHPCVVAWTPLNESWGVPEIDSDSCQQAHCDALVSMTHSLDGTRPVIDNDGWEHRRGDLLTIHTYMGTGAELDACFAGLDAVLAMQPGGRPMFAGDSTYLGQPILVTEFGGVKYAPNSTEGAWGYTQTDDPDAYRAKLAELTGAVMHASLIQGFCYTQLTDVESEQNGLLTYRREPKLPLEQIRAIICPEE